MVCPFKEDSCGDKHTMVFNDVGESQNSKLTFYPGDVCVFAMRAECGLPSFEPVGPDMDSLDIFAYSYDDSDIQTETYNSSVSSNSLFGG